MSFSSIRKHDTIFEKISVESMKTLMESAHLPNEAPVDVSDPWSLGMSFEYLKTLKAGFVTRNWGRLERRMNKYPNFMAHYEDGPYALDLHFVHAKSSRKDAIPLLLLHGWPGTFMDFEKVIQPLTSPSDPSTTAFHVVIPSLPGFVFSTLPRLEGWNLHRTAKLYNGLMTSVLGYTEYVCQGGDWGSHILHIMGSLYPDSLKLLHFNYFIGATPPSKTDIPKTDLQKRMLERENVIAETGMAYARIQETKPFTIGLAIGSSPLAILAYIGEKIYSWSDPDCVEAETILDNAALYYLTGCFATSVMIYNQTVSETRDLISDPSEGRTLRIRTKMAFSLFPYEMEGNKDKIEQVGPLVYFKEHDKGGHFPALDCPDEYVEDLREYFGRNWAFDTLDG